MKHYSFAIGVESGANAGFGPAVLWIISTILGLTFWAMCGLIAWATLVPAQS